MSSDKDTRIRLFILNSLDITLEFRGPKGDSRITLCAHYFEEIVSDGWIQSQPFIGRKVEERTTFGNGLRLKGGRPLGTLAMTCSVALYLSKPYFLNT
jgi:hypothetical protein